MKYAFLAAMLAGFVAALSVSYAQTTPTPLSELQKDVLEGAEKVGRPAAPPAEEPGDFTRYRMEEESNRLILALSVMGTAVLSLFLVLWYLKSREAAPETVVNGSGLVLVIFATVLVVILAKVDQQLTAATGILGAIAGYLFGKATKAPDAGQSPSGQAHHKK